MDAVVAENCHPFVIPCEYVDGCKSERVFMVDVALLTGIR